ncbi:Predicted DNA-binding transcriptional regulator YafY, contains an HTH and WYL domains [Amycolatopsis arida]|uniref:Predicted DNA-binding transcriptional regulator YafY, contains an HTH and WYL domains n=1 Tax=Amycolatopsis arida TaxID=587909 RepID=A0A1I5Z0Y5_9PSEU|nr:YafY family protein [Amycolatopsis arida]TDX90034.1 putative DNA-binding transcriptional regulator YafY [Amycolatopsis arida]SFQ50164.1 Predicted DNA-binding transcriptional regulator YafY, contains an HTH and WYL domains [Amycolatopsis arida]
MKTTSARLLTLLGLLQSRREWPGSELAERLGVSTRTVRRDVDTLRALDYPVEVALGPAGGYRLGAGATLPPLLLDDEEAVAVAVGLRTAAGSGVGGVGETAPRALAKLERMLPDRLRRRIGALQVSTVDVPGRPVVDAAELAAVAAACRDRECLRFDYRDRAGREQRREAEPHELVAWGGRWYLVAWDRGREGWRTFRVDRMRCRTPTGPRFPPRPVPGGNPAAFVTASVARAWPHTATVVLAVPAESEVARAAATYGRIEPVDADHCRLRLGADSPHALVFLLGGLEVDFVLEDPPELAERLRRQADRLRRAAAPPGRFARR